MFAVGDILKCPGQRPREALHQLMREEAESRHAMQVMMEKGSSALYLDADILASWRREDCSSQSRWP